MRVQAERDRRQGRKVITKSCDHATQQERGRPGQQHEEHQDNRQRHVRITEDLDPLVERRRGRGHERDEEQDQQQHGEPGRLVRGADHQMQP